MVLPDSRDRVTEERNYLNVCHRTIRNRPDVESILDSESFFDTSKRPTHDAWTEIYEAIWTCTYGDIKGSEIMSALRDHLASLQETICCYCRQPLLKGGYSRQIEHILPRATYGRFSFHFWNVALACERCNRIKKTKGHQAIDVALASYPDHSSFPDYFHPRFHSYSTHVSHAEVGLGDCRYVVYVGHTKQGKQLVEDVLTAAALEMTREATDPDLRASMKKIRDSASKQGMAGIEAIRQFDSALRKAIVQGSA